MSSGPKDEASVLRVIQCIGIDLAILSGEAALEGSTRHDVIKTMQVNMHVLGKWLEDGASVPGWPSIINALTDGPLLASKLDH